MKLKTILMLSLGLWALPAAADLYTAGLSDPTRPVDARANSEDAEAEQGLTAIRLSAEDRWAVIGGRTMKVGDRYGNAVIADIRPYEVVLEQAGRRTSLRLVPKLEKSADPKAGRHD